MKNSIFKLKLFTCLVLINGCNSIPQIEKTNIAITNYTRLLNCIDTTQNIEQKLKYLAASIKPIIKKKKTRDANVKVLLSMSEHNNRSEKLESFISSICDSGFFKRGFEIDSSIMFYRFDKPNEQGIGMAYLSDRYPFDYFDKQTALSKNFVKHFSYVFPRVYFIRENKINILSGDLDLSDRKEFRRMPTLNDTIFEKVYTYRKDNNDPIIDFSYHFHYVTYQDASHKWKEQIARISIDSSIITKDLINYIDYNTLKEMISQENSTELLKTIDTIYSNAKEKWFYAGTINKLGEWENNYTNIKKSSDIENLIRDTNNYIVPNAILYLRNSPPGDYFNDKVEINKKGKIAGSIFPNQRIYITGQKRISDYKNNISIWLKIKKIEKSERYLRN